MRRYERIISARAGQEEGEELLQALELRSPCSLGGAPGQSRGMPQKKVGTLWEGSSGAGTVDPWREEPRLEQVLVVLESPWRSPAGAAVLKDAAQEKGSCQSSW